MPTAIAGNVIDPLFREIEALMNRFTQLVILFWIVTLALTPAGRTLAQSENLIENPGFEQGQGDTVDVWGFYGDITWTDDEVHNGERAMRIAAADSSSSIQSSWFQAPAHARVEVSAWLKAENVINSGSYFKLRVTLQAFAEDKETRLRHWDLIALDGSFDWKRIESSVIVPPGVDYMRLSIQITESTGVFWVDDVDVRVAQTVPPVRELDLGAPVVIPQPWQLHTTGDELPLRRVGIVANDGDRRILQALTPILKQMDLPYVFVPTGGAVDLYDTIIYAGDSDNAELNRIFADHFRNIAWSDLGDEGYFLSTWQARRKTYIALGGNSEVARFYALQTLKQIINPERSSVAAVEIADRPSLALRGVPVGIQWFRQQDDLLDRMASFKLNFVWVQGSFLNEKFWFRWREPLTEDEKARIADFVQAAQQRFITPHIAIAPRGPDAGGYTTYSSDEEIDLVVDKMADLYTLGVRNFGLSFDDLVNFEQDVLYGDDIDFFNNDIGAAHVYFTEQVYSRLSDQHPDISFMLVPMTYDALSHRGDTDEAYLRTLGQLPDEIGIYSAIERTKGADAAIEFTNRPHMVWDNFWSSFYQSDPAPETVLPLERPMEFGAGLIRGYSFAPLIPDLEDAYLITWRTGADYAWAPERYDANASYQLAAAQHLTRDDVTGQVFAPPPVILPDSGMYAPPFAVTIGLRTEDGVLAEEADGVEIRYTIDGAIPTAASPRYTRPFVLLDGSNVRVRARVFEQGVAAPGTASAFFEVSPEGAVPPAVVFGPEPVRPLALLNQMTQARITRVIGGVAAVGAIAGGAYWIYKKQIAGSR